MNLSAVATKSFNYISIGSSQAQSERADAALDNAAQRPSGVSISVCRSYSKTPGKDAGIIHC